jgi:hypothetical protein
MFELHWSISITQQMPNFGFAKCRTRVRGPPLDSGFPRSWIYFINGMSARRATVSTPIYWALTSLHQHPPHRTFLDGHGCILSSLLLFTRSTLHDTRTLDSHLYTSYVITTSIYDTTESAASLSVGSTVIRTTVPLSILALSVSTVVKLIPSKPSVWRCLPTRYSQGQPIRTLTYRKRAVTLKSSRIEVFLCHLNGSSYLSQYKRRTSKFAIGKRASRATPEEPALAVLF